MATVQTYTLSREQMWETIIPYLENNWAWNDVVKYGTGGAYSTVYFYLDEDKTIGLYYEQGATG